MSLNGLELFVDSERHIRGTVISIQLFGKILLIFRLVKLYKEITNLPQLDSRNVELRKGSCRWQKLEWKKTSNQENTSQPNEDDVLYLLLSKSLLIICRANKCFIQQPNQQSQRDLQSYSCHLLWCFLPRTSCMKPSEIPLWLHYIVNTACPSDIGRETFLHLRQTSLGSTFTAVSPINESTQNLSRR